MNAGRRLAAGGVALLLAGCAVPTTAPEAAPSTAASAAPKGEGSQPPALAEDGAPTRSTPSPSAPTVAREAFRGSRALLHVLLLVDRVGERVAGSSGDVAARAYVAAVLRTAGWDVGEETFDLPQGGQSANVVATRAGAGREHGPVVVVGSHLDTVPGTVGANDNATGVGVLLAVAEELADEVDDLPVPVVLVAFGAEEFQAGTGVHHVGSTVLAEDIGERAVAMLSIDMVGNGPTTRIMGLDGYRQELVARLAAVAEDAGIADVTTGVRGDVSDHGPFARWGVPSAFLWSGPDERLHRPSDTVEHLDVDDLQRAGDLVLAWLRGLDGADGDGLEVTVP